MSAVIVLLIGPATDDRGMYAEYLRARGYTPVETDTTDDGLSHALVADVIVTGIRVPGSFDGVELVSRLRAHDGTQNKPVIVLTACAWIHEREAAERAGCDVFLAKPCLPDELVAAIRRVVALRAVPRPIPAPARSRFSTRQSGEVA